MSDPATGQTATRVEIKILEGRNMLACDHSGQSDPFVEVRLATGGEKREKHVTHVVKQTLSPSWEETFQFTAAKGYTLADTVCVFKCFDKDLIGTDDFMGRAEVSLAELGGGGDGDSVVDRWAKLTRKDGSAGELGELKCRVQCFFLKEDRDVVLEHQIEDAVLAHVPVASWFFKDEVSKHYDVQTELGSGNYATVRKGVCKKTGDVFAIKFIDKTKLETEDMDMLASECAVLKAVKHTNCITLHEIFASPKQLVLVLELATGGEMLDRITELGNYSESKASETAKGALQGLAYLHAAGIAHRDLKPENLLLASPEHDTVVKIADFGFAKMTSSQAVLKTACGTPEYVAPEVLRQLRGGYTTECDVWSMGIIIYIMLCGYPPFYDEHQPTLFHKIQKQPFKFDSPEWDGISKEAKDLITKMLTKDPAKRITAKQCLEHDWICRGKHHTADLSQAAAEIRRYNVRRRFRKGVNMAVLLNRLGKSTPEGGTSTFEV